jgi:hypothetical protein
MMRFLSCGDDGQRDGQTQNNHEQKNNNETVNLHGSLRGSECQDWAEIEAIGAGPNDENDRRKISNNLLVCQDKSKINQNMFWRTNDCSMGKTRKMMVLKFRSAGSPIRSAGAVSRST